LEIVTQEVFRKKFSRTGEYPLVTPPEMVDVFVDSLRKSREKQAAGKAGSQKSRVNRKAGSGLEQKSRVTGKAGSGLGISVFSPS